MERLICDYCGLPFRAPYKPAEGRRAFCCSGCAMASQLGIDGAKFPVTPQLVFDLVFGFGVFNQALLLLLATALGREGRPGGAALCLLISAAIGVLMYLSALAWQWRAGWLRASDAWVFALAAGPVFAGLALAWCTRGFAGAGLGLVVNLGLSLWTARGFVRRWRARRSI